MTTCSTGYDVTGRINGVRVTCAHTIVARVFTCMPQCKCCVCVCGNIFLYYVIYIYIYIFRVSMCVRHGHTRSLKTPVRCGCRRAIGTYALRARFRRCSTNTRTQYTSTDTNMQTHEDTHKKYEHTHGRANCTGHIMVMHVFSR